MARAMHKTRSERIRNENQITIDKHVKALKTSVPIRVAVVLIVFMFLVKLRFTFSIVFAITITATNSLYQRQLAQKRRDAMDLEVETRDIKKLKELLHKVPDWVQTAENSEFIEDIIGSLWPFLKGPFEETLTTTLTKTLNDNKGSTFKKIDISRLDFGHRPPLIQGLKYEADGDDVCHLYLDLVWNSNCDLVIKCRATAFNVTVQAKDIKFFGDLRLTFGPIIPEPPFFSAVTLSFMKVPTVNYNIVALGVIPVEKLPGVKRLLSETIDEAFSGMTWPRKILLTKPTNAKWKLNSEIPIGLVRVHFISASDLTNPGLFVADPYVEAMVGAQIYYTKTIQNNLNPTWNEATEFFVFDQSKQTLQIKVLDNNPKALGGNDVVMGEVELDIANLQSDVYQVRALHIGGSAIVELGVEFKPFVSPERVSSSSGISFPLGVPYSDTVTRRARFTIPKPNSTLVSQRMANAHLLVNIVSLTNVLPHYVAKKVAKITVKVGAKLGATHSGRTLEDKDRLNVYRTKSIPRTSFIALQDSPDTKILGADILESCSFSLAEEDDEVVFFIEGLQKDTITIRGSIRDIIKSKNNDVFQRVTSPLLDFAHSDDSHGNQDDPILRIHFNFLQVLPTEVSRISSTSFDLATRTRQSQLPMASEGNTQGNSNPSLLKQGEMNRLLEPILRLSKLLKKKPEQPDVIPVVTAEVPTETPSLLHPSRAASINSTSSGRSNSNQDDDPKESNSNNTQTNKTQDLMETYAWLVSGRRVLFPVPLYAVYAFISFGLVYIVGAYFSLHNYLGLALLLLAWFLLTSVQSFSEITRYLHKQEDSGFVRARDVYKFTGSQDHIQLLADWVRFPSVKRATWINSFSEQLWPGITAFATKKIEEQFEGAPLPAWLKQRVKLSKIFLGENPPQVVGIEHYNSLGRGGNIILDFDLNWASRFETSVEAAFGGVLGLSATVTDVALNGRLRVELGGLVSDIPGFSKVNISFVSSPEIAVDVHLQAAVGGFEIMCFPLNSIPFVPQLVNYGVGWALSPVILPQKHLMSLRSSKKVVGLPGAGILRVQLLGAQCLRKADLFSESDPICLLTLHSEPQQKARSRAEQNTSNPIWNQGFEFVVVNDKVLFTFSIFDHESHSAALRKSLGTAELMVSELKPDTPTNISLKLTESHKGSAKATLQVQLTFKPFELRKNPLISKVVPSLIMGSTRPQALAVIFCVIKYVEDLPMNAKKIRVRFGTHQEDRMIPVDTQGTNFFNTQTPMSEPIRMMVYDFDRRFYIEVINRFSDVIGVIKFKIKDLLGGKDRVLEKQALDDAAQGKIMYDICLRTVDVSDRSIVDKEAYVTSDIEGILRVTVLHANRLKNVDFLSKSDPYVRVQLQGTRTHQQTKAIDNNLDPVWTSHNQFEFIVSAENGEDPKINFTVFDFETLRPDRLLGEANLYKGDNVPNTSQKHVLELILKNRKDYKGTLTVVVEWKPFTTVESPLPLPEVPLKKLSPTAWSEGVVSLYISYEFGVIPREFQLAMVRCGDEHHIIQTPARKMIKFKRSTDHIVLTIQDTRAPNQTKTVLASYQTSIPKLLEAMKQEDGTLSIQERLTGPSGIGNVTILAKVFKVDPTTTTSQLTRSHSPVPVVRSSPVQPTSSLPVPPQQGVLKTSSLTSSNDANVTANTTSDNNGGDDDDGDDTSIGTDYSDSNSIRSARSNTNKVVPQISITDHTPEPTKRSPIRIAGKCTLQLEVVSALELPPGDNFGQTNAYTRISLGKSSGKSKAVNGRNPVFNFWNSFKTNHGEKAEFKVEMKHKSSLRKKVIAKAVFPLSQLNLAEEMFGTEQEVALLPQGKLVLKVHDFTHQ
eukprot:m.171685 g.171685  ORF g.171685 m.171685 type:complete len:1838 (+) comp31658_c0_seq3:311-5824(+)